MKNQFKILYFLLLMIIGISSGSNAQNSFLTVNPGSSLTVNGATIKIGGAVSSSGTFNATNGTIEMNGSSAQILAGDMFYNRAVKNLIVSNTGTGLSVSSASNDTLKISGTLSFGNANSKLYTGDNITLLSTATSTANVGVVNSGNIITGKVIVERYINIGNGAGQHGKSWQFVSTPTNGQTVKESWMENGNNISTAFGIQVPGTGGIAAGFDMTSPSSAIKYYNYAIDNWVGIANTNNPVYDQRGYMVYVRGDRSVNGTTVKNPTPTTLRTKGNLFTGNLTPIPVMPNKFESVGNPYASVIDFSLIAKDAGVDDKFYVWDPYLYGSYAAGGYQTISSVNNWKPIPGGTAAYHTGTVSKTIQSGQAFFVHATASQSDGSQPYHISFKEDCKVNSSSIVSFARPFGDISTTKRQFFSVSLFTGSNSNALIADGNTVAFDDSFSNSIDGNDALKIINSGENFGLKRSGRTLAIEAKNTVTVTDTIYYTMSNLKRQTYQLRFAPENMEASGLQAFLSDGFLNTLTPLSLTDSSFVDITVTSTAASAAADRFKVIFMQLAPLPVTFTSIKAYEKSKNILVEWKVENESSMQQYEVEKSVDGNQFSRAASLPALNRGSGNYSWLDKNAFGGYNYYRIHSIGKEGGSNYTKVVKVLIGKNVDDINVYPNPVVNRTINLQLTNQPAGVYGIRLLNALGQVIISKSINHAEGGSTETIKWDYQLVKGIYQLEVAKPDGSVQVIKVMN